MLQTMFVGIECKQTTLGRKYDGRINVTLSGRTCQAWSSQSPHIHGMVEHERLQNSGFIVVSIMEMYFIIYKTGPQLSGRYPFSVVFVRRDVMK